MVLDTHGDAVADLGLDGSGMAAIISAELSNLVDGKADIVARSDMATLIQRMEEAQLMGCSEPSCMTNIAALAEADLLVASKVTPAGEGSTFLSSYSRRLPVNTSSRSCDLVRRYERSG